MPKNENLIISSCPSVRLSIRPYATAILLEEYCHYVDEIWKVRLIIEPR